MRAALCAAAVALLAGCGGGGMDSGDGDAPVLAPAAVRDVPARVREAGTYAFDAAYSREVEGREPERYLELSGAVDVGEGSGRLRVDLSAIFAGLPSAKEFEDPVELEWTRTELRGRLGGEETSRPRQRARESGGLIGRLPDEPTAVVELLAAAQKILRVGEEDVGGRPTVRFSCLVDARRAGEAGAPSELTGAFEQALHGPTLPLDVWLDVDGLPRRIEYIVRLEPTVVRGKQILPPRVVRGTYDLSAFGEPVGDG